MSVNPADFDYLRDLVKKRSGISLSDEKEYLVDSRLLPLARRMDLKDIAELVSKVRNSNDEGILAEITEAMTTNETSFFRDIKPFDQFRDDIVPHITKNSKDHLIRIWCAACSTGQEPYSLAMIIMEFKAKYPDYKFEIVATDINRTVIKKAEAGIYTQFEVQRGLPITHLIKYFVQEKSYGERWVLKNEVKSMVNFKYLNLLGDYSALGRFDIIFCRNVLIYFDSDIKTKVMDSLSSSLKPHGIICLGASETTSDFTDKLQKFQELRGVYSLKSAK